MLYLSKRSLYGVIIPVWFLFSTPIMATPIVFNFSGAWDFSHSAPFGPLYDVDATFDNGGSVIESQVFGQSDFISVLVESGSYSNTFYAFDITGWFRDFTSDSLGRLGSGWVNLTSGTDTFHFDPWFSDEYVSTTGEGWAGYFESSLSTPGSLVNDPGDPVPEPTTLLLFGTGIAGLVGAGIRRKK